MKQELQVVIERVQSLELMNKRLSQEQLVSKSNFKLVKLSQAEYEELKAAELHHELSLSEMVSMRVYEQIGNLTRNLQISEEERCKIDANFREIRDDFQRIRQELDLKCDENEQLKFANTRLEKRLMNLLGPGSFPHHEPQSLFEPAPAENAHQSSDFGRLKQQLDGVSQHLNSERERLVKELELAREALKHSQEDASQARRQAVDSSQRSMFLEERLATLTSQMDLLKKQHDENLEKYLNSKETMQNDFNSRLSQELDNLRMKHSTEFDRLTRQMKTCYEQELNQVKESRDLLMMEKDKIKASEKELQERYEKILVEFKQLEFSLESQTADLVSQLRVKTFELDRLKQIMDETDGSLRHSKESYEKLRDNFETICRDHQKLITEFEFERKKLLDENESLRGKLAAFERTEQDLDDLVMQAADTAMDNEAEKILISYGAVAAVPPSFRRRLEQSVRLARRVLELERVNNALRSDYERKVKENELLRNETNDLNNLLSISRNPDQKVIVEAYKTRDEEMRELKFKLTEAETQLEVARHELSAVSKEKDEMARDMYTLLNHQNELAQIKQQLSGGPRNQQRKTQGRFSPSKRQHLHNISPPVFLS